MVLREREGERGILDVMITRAGTGHGNMCLIEGVAGVGKSALIRSACQTAAAEGLLVQAVRGSTCEQRHELAMISQLCASPDGEDHTFPTPQIADAESDRWGRRDGAPTHLASTDARRAYRIISARAATAPLLLAIDDLHWCDQSSLEFVSYLFHRLMRLPVLLLASFRPAEAATRPAILTQLIGDPRVSTLRPGPLSPAGVSAVLGDRLGMPAADAFAAECHRLTGGNPQMLSALCHALAAHKINPDAAHLGAIGEFGPAAVTPAILARLSTLPAAAVQVIRAAAVAGDGADLHMLAALADSDEDSVAAAVRLLVKAEVLGTDSPLRFIQPLVRDAVYRDMGPGVRELTHARAARLLAARPGGDEPAAAHLLATAPRGRRNAVTVLRRAAAAALDRGAPRVAVDYLRRALGEPPSRGTRPTTLAELGDAELRTNAVRAGVQHLREARDGLADEAQRAVIGARLAEVELIEGSWPAAARIAAQAAEGLPEQPTDSWRDLDGLLQAIRLCALPDAGDNADGTENIAYPPPTDSQAASDAGSRQLAVARAFSRASHATGCAQDCARVALAALSGGDLLPGNSLLLAWASGRVLTIADRPEAPGLWRECAARADLRGDRRLRIIADTGLGRTLLDGGDLTAAEEVLRSALHTAGENHSGPAAGEAGLLVGLARVNLEQGNLPGARHMLSRAQHVERGTDADALYRMTGLELLLAEHRFAESLDASGDLARIAGGTANPTSVPWRSLRARALAGLGRRTEATELVREELAAARRWGAPRQISRSLRMLAELSRTDAADLLAQAVEVAAESTSRLEYARALLARGAQLRRARQLAAARDMLRQGLDLAWQCGAAPLAALARAELAAAGVKTPSRDRGNPRTLTPSERRVADLAMAGHTNRDIARALHVTTKTVEVHLSSSYRKLGIRGRAGLAAALGEPALPCRSPGQSIPHQRDGGQF